MTLVLLTGMFTKKTVAFMIVYRECPQGYRLVLLIFML